MFLIKSALLGYVYEQITPEEITDLWMDMFSSLTRVAEVFLFQEVVALWDDPGLEGCVWSTDGAWWSLLSGYWALSKVSRCTVWTWVFRLPFCEAL